MKKVFIDRCQFEFEYLVQRRNNVFLTLHA
jgi:hypothetical protein